MSIKRISDHPGAVNLANISAVKFARDIAMGKRVTIFVGDNGSGKSTLLETLAYSVNVPLIGGFVQSSNAGFEAAKLLKPFMKIEWKRQTSKGFFSGPKTSAIF